MIEYIKKNVITVEMGIVAHGVNCQHRMGSGVAKDIRARWPIVYDEYMKMPKGAAMLGTAHLVRINEGQDDLFVANCYTQQFYGYGGGAYANTKSIADSLDQVAKHSAILSDLPIFMPRIGCGLGGLDWERDVEPIINEIANRRHQEFFVCDL